MNREIVEKKVEALEKRVRWKRGGTRGRWLRNGCRRGHSEHR